MEDLKQEILRDEAMIEKQEAEVAEIEKTMEYAKFEGKIEEH